MTAGFTHVIHKIINDHSSEGCVYGLFYLKESLSRSLTVESHLLNRQQAEVGV